MKFNSMDAIYHLYKVVKPFIRNRRVCIKTKTKTKEKNIKNIRSVRTCFQFKRERDARIGAVWMLRIQECHKQYTLTFRKLRGRVRRGVDTLKFPLLLYKKAPDKRLCPKVSSHETTTKSDLISALVTSNSQYYRLSLCAIQILIRSGNQQQQYTCDMYPISDLENKCVHLLSLADWYHPFLLLSEILTKSTSQIVRLRAGRWRDVST